MGLVLIATAPPALAAGGDLDITFGGKGVVTTSFAPEFSTAYAYGVAVQADGKIVAAGFAGEGGPGASALARYNPDGTLDASFGSGGKTTTDFGPGSDAALGVAIQKDGKIVTAGFEGRGRFAIVRYNPDGTVDATFSGDGRATTDFLKVTKRHSGYDVAFGVAIQADGRLVAAGSAGGFVKVAVVRYNPDGTLDSTFGGDGKTTTNFSDGDDWASAVAIQADGRIVVAGSSHASGFALARYNPDGTLDSSFGGDGVTTTEVTPGLDAASGVVIQADGKIVAAGSGLDAMFAVARYNPDGALDTTFSSDGMTTTDFSPGYDVAYGVGIQADSKIVVAGTADASDFALARYLSS